MNMALNVLNKVEINVGFNDIVYLYCNLSRIYLTVIQLFTFPFI